MRYSISILERYVQDNEINITEKKIKDLVGIPKLVQINKLVKNIIEYNPEGSLEVTEEIITEGKDIVNLLWEVIKYVKDLLIYKTRGDIEIYSEEEKSSMKELVAEVSTERLIKIINELSELENALKWSSQKNIQFKTGIIKVSSHFTNDGYEDIKKRLLEIEEQLKSGKVVQKVDNFSQKEGKSDLKVENINTGNTKNTEKQNIENAEIAKETSNSTESKVENKKEEKASKEAPININENNESKKSGTISNASNVKNWKGILDNLKSNGKMMLYTNLVNTTAKEINDMTVGIEFKKGITPFGKAVLEKPENMQYLVKLVSQMYGKEMRIKLIENDTDNKKADDIKDLPFNIIE